MTSRCDVVVYRDATEWPNDFLTTSVSIQRWRHLANEHKDSTLLNHYYSVTIVKYFWPRNLVKRGILHEWVCQSVRLSVCHILWIMPKRFKTSKPYDTDVSSFLRPNFRIPNLRITPTTALERETPLLMAKIGPIIRYISETVQDGM